MKSVNLPHSLVSLGAEAVLLSSGLSTSWLTGVAESLTEPAHSVETVSSLCLIN